MKRLVRFLLNSVPRRYVQRVADKLLPLAGLFYAGRRIECPVCGSHFRRLMPYGYVDVRENALCPRCLSLERHRLLWLWLRRETDLFSGGEPPRLLHIAPEVCLMKPLRKLYRAAGRTADYVTADLESPLADVKLDVQAIPFGEGSFDVVICNHILEHVADDRLAMRELHRILKDGGWGIVLSPADRTLEHTFEDDSITDPAERTRIFGQYDHRRNYGRDYADRLREAGFDVEENDYLLAFTPEEQVRYALRSEIIYIVRKRRHAAAQPRG